MVDNDGAVDDLIYARNRGKWKQPDAHNLWELFWWRAPCPAVL